MQLIKLVVLTLFVFVSFSCTSASAKTSSLQELTKVFEGLDPKKDDDYDEGLEKVEDAKAILAKELKPLASLTLPTQSEHLDKIMRLVVAALPFDMESQLLFMLVSTWENPKVKPELQRWLSDNPSCEVEELQAFFQKNDCEKSNSQKDCHLGFSDVECAARKKSGANPHAK